MLLPNYYDLNNLTNIIETYTFATGVGTKAFNAQGDNLCSCKGKNNNSSFCQMVQLHDHGLKKCKQSYIYGGLQSAKLGEAYIYFCPFGLVNWAVPVFSGSDLNFFITGGPVLMHEVDALMIKDIISQNIMLKNMGSEINDQLEKLEVIEPSRVKHLADMLLIIAKNIMADECTELKNRKEINSINDKISEKIANMKADIEIDYQKENEKLYLFEKEKELISKVKLGDKEAAMDVLHDILSFSYFESAEKFEMVKLKAIELTVVLARAVIEEGADLEVILGLEYMHLNYIKVASDINELTLCLNKVLDAFVECPFSLKNVKNKDVIFRAMDYIRNNFHKEITLENVAQQVGLNTSYFSKLFKDETGESYTDYLNRVRIEYSKHFLKGGFSLADTAQMVGFSDQSYFSKIFKKFEGLPPGKYRKNIS